MIVISSQQHNIDVSHVITIALGIIVLLQISTLLTLLYIIISVLGLIWFMAKICPHCKAFGTPSCQSGYGILSSRMFARPRQINFRRAFKRNIISVAVQWFIPLIAGIYRLYKEFDLYLVLTLILFIVVAFIWLPVVSRKTRCKNCPQKEDCGWFSSGAGGAH